MKLATIIGIAAIIVMTLIPAIIDGQSSFRWGRDVETLEFATRLEEFPEQIGDWKLASSIPLDQSSIIQLQPIAFINRVYVNQISEKQAHLFILFGPTGPTAVHTPDICFSSRDYKKLGEREKISIATEDSKSSCFRSAFASRDVNSSYLLSWYGWTDNGTWVASENPRFFFAKNQSLLKVQIAANYDTRKQMDNDPIMNAFVQEIEQLIKKIY